MGGGRDGSKKSPQRRRPRRAEVEREPGKSDDSEAKGRNSFLVTLSDRRTEKAKRNMNIQVKVPSLS